MSENREEAGEDWGRQSSDGEAGVGRREMVVLFCRVVPRESRPGQSYPPEESHVLMNRPALELLPCSVMG